MKKIPGTLYEFELLTDGSANPNYNIQIYYRKELILEKGHLTKEEIIQTVHSELTRSNLTYPINRIEITIEDALKSIKTAKVSFLEGTVSKIIENSTEKQTEEISKIILMGLGNAGKTCIYERVFEQKKPWELIHSTATKGISYRNYEIGTKVKPMIWDLGGQTEYRKTYHDQMSLKIFSKAKILLYIIDISDPSKHQESTEELQWAAKKILESNPNAKIYVFLHKIDRIQEKNAVIAALKQELGANLPPTVRYIPTSIFDESLFRAWSEIIRELCPKSTFLNVALSQLKNQENIQDVILIDKNTGLTVGSTLDESNDEVYLGMLSLLMNTLDRMCREMKKTGFDELSLKFSDESLLVINIPELNLIITAILMQNIKNETEQPNLKKIKQVLQDLILQIKQLW